MSAFVVEDIEEDIAPVVPSAEDDSAPLRCQHPGCTNGIVKPARGRTPKYCEDHKTPSARNGGNRSKASGKTWARAVEVETHLTKYTTLIALALGGAAFSIGDENLSKTLAADASVVATKAPPVVHELVELAKDDRNLQRVLESLAAPSKYSGLTMAVIGLVVPLLGNHGFIPAGIAAAVAPNGGESK